MDNRAVKFYLDILRGDKTTIWLMTLGGTMKFSSPIIKQAKILFFLSKELNKKFEVLEGLCSRNSN